MILNGYNSLMRVIVQPDVGPYSHAGTGYANPDAVTQIASGYSTSTFSYDNDGNLVQKTVDGTTTTYIYDYANRLTALEGHRRKPGGRFFITMPTASRRWICSSCRRSRFACSMDC